ncbi:MAG: DNA replication/repair protein RecF [Hyphomicrobiaceae bacterium]
MLTGAAASVERLRLSNFRSYADLSLELTPEPVVLFGPNGAGKTNLLEAVSLLAPGSGLRRSPYAELVRIGGGRRWAVSAVVRTASGTVTIGTGPSGRSEDGEGGGRIVRIDQQPRGSQALAEIVEVVWLTPAMDGLFTGPASDRRRFIDRLIVCFDPSHRTRLNAYERAARQRNRALEIGGRPQELVGLELQIAETGVAIAAARVDAIERIQSAIADRLELKPRSAFPWTEIAVDGWLEQALGERPAVEVEDAFAQELAQMRDRDRAAGRQLKGPHLTDLLVGHGPKALPAKVCSTGEQKALLIDLILSHAELVRRLRSGEAPILLMDEIAAHLDESRRRELFAELVALGSQAWLTGTDREPFQSLGGMAQFLAVEGGRVVTA